MQVWTWGKCDHGELGHGAEAQVPRRSACLPRAPWTFARASTRVPRVFLCGRPALRSTPGFCYDVAKAGLFMMWQRMEVPWRIDTLGQRPRQLAAGKEHVLVRTCDGHV